MQSIAEHINFKIVNNELIVHAPRQYYAIVDSFEDFGDFPDLWQKALDTLNGKRPFPYWTGGDSCEIHVTQDGTTFGVQPEFAGERLTIPNQDAKQIIKTYLAFLKSNGQPTTWR